MIALTVLNGCSQPDAQSLKIASDKYEVAMQARQRSALAGALVYSGGSSQNRTDTAGENMTWLAMSRKIAQNEQGGEAAVESAEKQGEAAIPPSQLDWRHRYGPAYPGDICKTLGRDAKELPATLCDDTKALFTNPCSLLALAAAGAAGITINATGVDNSVADHFEKNGSQLNTFWDSVGDVGGNPGTHFAVAGAMYLTSQVMNDNRTYELSKTMINALAINGLLTMGLKVCARTESPNGDEFGWPSGHTSSTFTFATVMAEEYGPMVGVPLFAFASFVGYERIDARNHDFSDVISGALIGIAVGHAVSQNHKMRILDMDVIPYVNPENGMAGVAMVKRW